MSIRRASALLAAVAAVFGLGLAPATAPVALAQVVQAGQSVLLTPEIPSSDVGGSGKVFFDKTFDVTFSGGQAVIASTPNGLGNVGVDDQIEVTVTKPDGTTANVVRNYEFQPPSPPIDLGEALATGKNSVRVVLRDTFGVFGGSTALYLVGAVGSGADPNLHTCVGNGAGGWKFSAHVSDNDGLVLDESSYKGRLFTKDVSVPYVEVMWTASSGRGRPAQRSTRVELTRNGTSAHPGVPGAPLLEPRFECSSGGSGDIFVRAVYAVPDVIFNGAASPTTITQEYRFRAADSAHPCEPSEKLSCGRFWPSVSYSTVWPTACASAPGGGACTLFASMRTVQRIAFRPSDVFGGAVDAYKDRNRITPTLNGASEIVVETKGSGGSMKYEDIDQAIVGGRRGDWDSIHQAPNVATTGPNPFTRTPGCAECVHMHWAWGTIANQLRQDWTDGRPEILDKSTQDATFGIVRISDKPEERDPVTLPNGWRQLVDRKGSDASLLRENTPIVFWEMTSRSTRDAAFPILDNYRHGGNGAIFFGD